MLECELVSSRKNDIDASFGAIGSFRALRLRGYNYHFEFELKLSVRLELRDI